MKLNKNLKFKCLNYNMRIIRYYLNDNDENKIWIENTDKKDCLNIQIL